MKAKTVKLCSRYGELNYLEPIDYTTDSYVLKTKHEDIRMGYTKDNELYIDPVGGPMIIVNRKILELNKIVKTITHKKDVGFIITFK